MLIPTSVFAPLLWTDHNGVTFAFPHATRRPLVPKWFDANNSIGDFQLPNQKRTLADSHQGKVQLFEIVGP